MRYQPLAQNLDISMLIRPSSLKIIKSSTKSATNTIQIINIQEALEKFQKKNSRTHAEILHISKIIVLVELCLILDLCSYFLDVCKFNYSSRKSHSFQRIS